MIKLMPIISHIPIFFFPILLYIFKDQFKQTPYIELWIFYFIFILSMYSGSIQVFISEKKIDKNYKFSSYHNFLWWWWPRFSTRYFNLKYISLPYSLFISSFIFIISIILINLYILFINKTECTISRNEYNELDFLFNEGIIVVFVFATITIGTFLNVIIHKYQSGRELTTLEEIHYLIIKELKSEKWNQITEKFCYICDYSAAIGHISGRESFKNYLKALHRFLQHKDKINFKAIVLDKLNLYKNYQREFKLNDLETFKWIIDANDSFFKFIDHGGDEGRKCKIFYKPFRKINHKAKDDIYGGPYDYLQNLEFPPIDPDGINIIEKHLDKLNDIKDNDINIEELKEDCIVYYKSSLGLTRFIVSNLFVIQFLAVTRKHKNIPIGFISYDVVMIERYKQAFEKYLMDEIKD